MAYEFTTHEIPAMDILFVRDAVAADGFPAFLGGAFPELYAHVERHRITPAGHPFVIYHAFGPDRIDAQVCAPILGPASGGGRLQIGTIPAATVVRTSHVGRYEDLGSAYAALSEWVADHRLTPGGPIRERYLTGVGDGVPPEAYRTELDQPIEPAPVVSATDAPQAPVGVG
jgi:effector-binding domain-containing protein